MSKSAAAGAALACGECGHRSFQWVGRCPGCGAWDSLAEVVRAAGPALVQASPLVSMSSVDLAAQPALGTGLVEFDRVLGGGLVRGSVVLLAGEPGVGKSTLVLQAAAGFEKQDRRVCLFCGEESLHQVAARARRLGGPASAQISSATHVLEVMALMSRADVAVVDSVQTLYDPQAPGRPGSVTQVRSCAARLAACAKDSGTSLVLVGHVTKDGSVAGPRALEHLVDVVLTFEGDRGHALRTLRGVKNRFGATGEVGVFEMDSRGLRQVPDASSLFLSGRRGGVPGSMVGCILEGRRALAVQVQALVVDTPALPKRVAQGFEFSKLGLMLAVLHKWAGVSLHKFDVYASVAGGIRASEPGVELPLALSIYGSAEDRTFPSDVAAVGEVGLGGEIRPVAGMQSRIKELSRLGFKKIICPAGAKASEQGQIVRVPTIGEAIKLIGSLSPLD